MGMIENPYEGRHFPDCDGNSLWDCRCYGFV